MKLRNSLAVKIGFLPFVMAIFMVLTGVFYFFVIHPVDANVDKMNQLLQPISDNAAKMVQNIYELEITVESFQRRGNEENVLHFQQLVSAGHGILDETEKLTKGDLEYQKLLKKLRNDYDLYSTLFFGKMIENSRSIRAMSYNLLQLQGTHIESELSLIIEDLLKKSEKYQTEGQLSKPEQNALNAALASFSFLGSRTQVIDYLWTDGGNNGALVEDSIQRTRSELSKVLGSTTNKQRRLQTEEVLGDLDVYHTSWSVLEKLVQERDSLITQDFSLKSKELLQSVLSLQDYARAETDENTAAVKRAIEVGNIVYPLFIIISCVIGLLIASWLARGISKPLVYAINIFKEIADGKLNNKIDIPRPSDEVGQLLDGLVEMQNSVKNIVHRVSESSEKLMKNAYHLSEVSRSTEEQINRQKDDMHSVTEMVENVEGMVHRVTEDSKEASVQAHEATSLLTDGRAVVADTVKSIRDLSAGVTEYCEVITKLEAESREVNVIANVINEVAEQTGLLALNAAIEAARAGEQGRGFAVVADEVRQLAHQTQSSVVQVQDTVKEIRESSDTVVSVMERNNERVEGSLSQAETACSSLDTILEFTERLCAMSDKVAHAMQEQEHLAESINQYMHRIDSVSGEVAQAATKTRQASLEIESSLVDLKAMVDVFEVDDKS